MAYNKNYDLVISKEIVEKSLNKENELIDIEKRLKKIEDSVGHFQYVNYNTKSITEIINSSVDFIETKLNKTDEERGKIIEELLKVLDEYKTTKGIILLRAGNFIKIKESYLMLGLYEQYETIFEYIKKRLKAIKIIHESSDTFNENLDFLKEQMAENEKSFETLGKNYGETFEEFKNLEDVLEKVKGIDARVSKMLME